MRHATFGLGGVAIEQIDRMGSIGLRQASLGRGGDHRRGTSGQIQLTGRAGDGWQGAGECAERQLSHQRGSKAESEIRKLPHADFPGTVAGERADWARLSDVAIRQEESVSPTSKTPRRWPDS